MWKPSQVFLLPTGELDTNTILLNPSTKKLSLGKAYAANFYKQLGFKTYYMYFTTADKIDKIKRGERHLDSNKLEVLKADDDQNNGIKIIATNNESLLTELPKPSEMFLEEYFEEYNKENQIVNVLVEFERKTRFEADRSKRKYPLNGVWYEDILKINLDNTINIKPAKTSWNRKEVIEFAKKYGEQIKKHVGVDNDGESCYCTLNEDKWFEENI